MNKLVMAAATCAMTVGATSVAYADHVPVGETYKNRGQCERAIAQARNDARRDSMMNSGDYNKDFESGNFYCEKMSNGMFMIVNGPDAE
jgi:hypothetical protein